MSEGSEVRMGLVRHRVSQREFAERCGIGLSELNLMLHGEGDLSDEVRGAYAVLEAGGLEETREEMVEEGMLERGDFGMLAGHRMCWSGRAVRNPNLLVVCFDDGETGMVRKKSWFKPRAGLPMEVEPSEESGMWRLVGDYRPNGVRLDA